MHRLTRNTQNVGDLLPAHPGTQRCLDLSQLQGVSQCAQRSHSPQPGARIISIRSSFGQL